MPFFFAWCGPNEPFSAAHEREDEAVFAFDIAHEEGQIPTLSIDIRNPHIGLLSPGRLQWAWLSYQSSTGVLPLFHGRLVALPSNLLDEIVTLEFIARPNDYLAQKQAIASSLMVEPFYDPIWIDQTKLTDPDTVLETYAMAWHVDRFTVVSISDILFGEDGSEEFLPEDSFYDSVSISFAQSPQTRVVFEGTVQWTQVGTGIIEMPDVSLSAWNGQQIINDWPKQGDELRGGWSVEDAVMTNWSDQLGGNNPVIIDVGGGTSVNTTPIGTGGSGVPIIGDIPGSVSPQMPGGSPGGARSVSVSYTNEAEEHQNGDVISMNESATYDDFGGLMNGVLTSSSTSVSVGDGGVSSVSISGSWVANYGEAQTSAGTGSEDGSDGDPITVPSLFGQLMLRYNLERDRTEVLRFVMDSDIQPMVLLPPDEAINQIDLSMHGADLGLPLDAGGVAPIGDPGRSAFFPSDRGKLAMQYPMLVARAHLAQSARAAKVTFDCTFERALNLSCRKNAILHDARLPGGQVIGKITEYHIKADGDRGELIGTVQVEATIGNGTSIVVSTGTPIYVAEGYVVPGYQFYSDADVVLPTGDATIVMPEVAVVDDGLSLPLTFDQAVMAFEVHEGTPFDVIAAGGAATADPTWLEIVLRPVTGQKFETGYDLGSSTVVLPKLIDLAAPNA
jgi:hypothetical protein